MRMQNKTFFAISGAHSELSPEFICKSQVVEDWMWLSANEDAAFSQAKILLYIILQQPTYFETYQVLKTRFVLPIHPFCIIILHEGTIV